LLKEALAIRRGRRDADPEDIAIDLHALGAALLTQGKFPEAELILRGFSEIDTARLPKWITRHAMSLLGGALDGQGKHEEADPLLLQGYQGMPPEAPVRRRETLERLIQHYEAWHKPEAAAEWRKVLGTEFPQAVK
jgi:hypothetical protein